MKYDVLTIDTQVLHANGFDLEGGLLTQIAQFRDGSTRFVLSRVTLRETLRHLTFERDDDQAPKPWMIHKVELLGHGAVVDFGYIEPDYSQGTTRTTDNRLRRPRPHDS